MLLHSLAYAGWVDIFITGLNLIPIGQLDGGHVLYALLLKRAHRIATFVLLAAMRGVAVFGYWGWSLMLMLLFVMGPITNLSRIEATNPYCKTVVAARSRSYLDGGSPKTRRATCDVGFWHSV